MISHVLMNQSTIFLDNTLVLEFRPSLKGEREYTMTYYEISRIVSFVFVLCNTYCVRFDTDGTI
jgi:hypothetical protein